MVLGVFSEVSPGVFQEHSAGDTFANPVTTVHHGRNGDSFDIKLFVRSDGSFDHTNIQVQPISTSDDIGMGIEKGTSGWGVKLFSSATPGYVPTEEDWSGVEYGVAIDVADMSAASGVEYSEFWYRPSSPKGESVGNKTNIKLGLLYTESP